MARPIDSNQPLQPPSPVPLPFLRCARALIPPILTYSHASCDDPCPPAADVDQFRATIEFSVAYDVILIDEDCLVQSGTVSCVVQ